MNEYRIVQNGGGGKLRRISNFKKLAGNFGKLQWIILL